MKTFKFCKCCNHTYKSGLLQKIMDLDNLDLSKVNNNNQKIGPSTNTLPNSNNRYIDSLIWGGTKWNWSPGNTTKLTYYFGPALNVNNCPPGVASLHGGNISTSTWEKKEKE